MWRHHRKLICVLKGFCVFPCSVLLPTVLLEIKQMGTNAWCRLAGLGLFVNWNYKQRQI